MKWTGQRRPYATLSLFFIVTAALITVPVRAADVPAETVKAHLYALTAPEMRGRGSGEPGNERAARYIADSFKKFGLKPVGTGRQGDADARGDGSGYFQPFRFPQGVAQGRNNRLSAVWGNSSRPRTYRADSEFEPFPLSGSGSVENTEVVFVGYGVQLPSGRDEYAGVDVKDRVVLALAGSPSGASGVSDTIGITGKALLAREKGAKALLVVLPKDTDELSMPTDVTSADAGLPILLLRRSVAEDWLKAAGRNLETVETALANGPQSFPLTGFRVRLAADVRRVTKVTANVLGLLEGTDPALKNEVVVIGAHMDHLGMGGSRSLASGQAPAVHPGADDNASGTAGVLALAEYFSRPENRPRRSLLFICFSGEEMGLLGSAHYVRHPAVPLERTVAMLNMDMVGRLRDNRLMVIGTGTAEAWKPLLDELNRDARFELRPDESGFGGSDHQSFYSSHIPVLFFFTGVHPDYHKPSDTADKINAADLSRVVAFVGNAARRIGDMPQRPAYRQVASAQSPGPSRAGARVSLGTIPEYGGDMVGVLLGGVRPGSPAEKAGLKAGDVIVEFGGKAIRNIEEYTFALSQHKPGDVVKIVVKRGAESVTVTATLAESQRPR